MAEVAPAPPQVPAGDFFQELLAAGNLADPAVQDWTSVDRTVDEVEVERKRSKFKGVIFKTLEALNVPNKILWSAITANIIKPEMTFSEAYDYLEGTGAGRLLAENLPKDWRKRRFAVQLIGDIAGDPLTYLGFGALTKIGKFKKAYQGAMKTVNKMDDLVRAGKTLTVRQTRKLDKARKIIDDMGKLGIKSADDATLAVTKAEQAAKGERALLRAEIPFTEKGVTLISGEKAYKKMADISTSLKEIPAINIVDKKLKEWFTTAATTVTDLKHRQALTKIAQEASNVKGELLFRNSEVAEDFVREMKKIGVTKDDFDRITALAEHTGEITGTGIVEDSARRLREKMVEVTDKVYDKYGMSRKSLGAALGTEQTKIINQVSKLKDDIIKGSLKSVKRKFFKEQAKKVGWGLSRPERENLLRDFIVAEKQATKKLTGFDVTEFLGEPLVRVKEIERRVPTKEGIQLRKYFISADDALDSRLILEAQNKIKKSKKVSKALRYIDELEEAKDRVPFYLTHILTDDAIVSLGRQVKGGRFTAKRFDERTVSDFYRKWRKRKGAKEFEPLTAEEVNRAMREKIKEKSFLDLFRKEPKAAAARYFETDPGVIVATAGERSAKAASGHVFRTSISDYAIKGGLATQDATKAGRDWRKIPMWAKTADANLFVAPELADWIERSSPFYLVGGDASSMMRAYDTVLSWFKASATVPFPSFHARNAISNIWQNFLGGVKDPTVYRDAFRIQRIAGKKALSKTERYKLLDNILLPNGMTGREVYEEAIKYGVVGTGFVDIDLASKGMKNLRKAGSAIEHNARMAHFIDRLNKFDTVSDAAESVKKFLFDYADFTPFESRVMGRLFPFYRWTAKNIPLQLEMLVKQPGKFVGIQHAGTAIKDFTSEKDIAHGLLPEYMREGYFLEFEHSDGKRSLVPIAEYIPSLTVIRNLTNPFETITFMTTPVAKSVLEQVFNKSLFKKRDIQWAPYQTEKLFGLDVPSRVNKLLRDVRLINEANQLISKTHPIFGEPRTMPEKLAKAAVGVSRFEFDEAIATNKHIRRMNSEIRKIRQDAKLKFMSGDAEGFDKMAEKIQRIINEYTEKIEELK